VAAGNGQFLYLGWVYPHLARRSSDRGAGAHHPRAKSGGVAMGRDARLRGRCAENAGRRAVV
jgi:hypothetical protein